MSSENGPEAPSKPSTTAVTGSPASSSTTTDDVRSSVSSLQPSSVPRQPSRSTDRMVSKPEPSVEKA
jgi:hypothetical protein